jgi:hypothetical protein
VWGAEDERRRRFLRHPTWKRDRLVRLPATLVTSAQSESTLRSAARSLEQHPPDSPGSILPRGRNPSHPVPGPETHALLQGALVLSSSSSSQSRHPAHGKRRRGTGKDVRAVSSAPGTLASRKHPAVPLLSLPFTSIHRSDTEEEPPPPSLPDDNAK